MNLEEALAKVVELDYHAHLLRRLHDGEFGDHWRQASRQD
jgi:hypothetical protein